MSLKEQVYSVLFVSSAERFNIGFSAVLQETPCEPVVTVSSVSAAEQTLTQRSFDFIFINSPLPDDSGVRFAVDSCRLRGTVILLLVPSDLHDEVYDRVAEHGVFTLPKPFSRTMLLRAVSWMVSTRSGSGGWKARPASGREDGGDPAWSTGPNGYSSVN